MIRVLILFIGLCGTIAQADTLRVISGEHADFTRIAVIMARNITLTQEMVPDGLILSFADGPHQIELTDAFRRIGRTRIADIVREGDNRLRVTFACPCKAVIGRGGPGIVTLDVSDASPAIVSEQPSADPMAVKLPEPPLLRYGGLPRTGGVAAATQTPPFHLPPATVATEGPKPQVDPQIARGLQMQIARAVSQGLLEPSFVAPAGRILDPAPPDRDRVPAPSEPPQIAVPAPVNRTESAQPAAADGRVDQTVAIPGGGNFGCLPAQQVDVAAWGDATAFGQVLGALQRDAFSESGRPNRVASRNLARYYLFFGMGAEARATLVAADLLDGQDKPLHALAQIMDHGKDEITGVFKAQGHCEAPVALWAVLADPAPSVTIDAAIGSVIQAFSALPWHLKDNLGPVLAQRLRLAGNTEAAETVLRIIKRANENSSPALKLEEAEISLAADSEEEAVALLKNVAEANGKLAPEALVRLIDVEITAGRAITPETAMLAASYTVEYRKTPIADDLWRVNVLALAASGQFDKTFAMLTEPRPEQLREKLWAASLQTLTKQADDVAFAHWSMNVPPTILTGLEPETSNAVARRLIDLGFAPAAEPYLTGGADGAAGRMRKILRSRSALQQNRPRRAEAELTGLSGPDIDRLRAEARFATGDYVMSQKMFDAIDATREEVEAAFLAGDWMRVSDVGPVEIASFGALALEAAPKIPVLSQEEPLKISRRLVSDSERTRTVISEMLKTIEVSDGIGDEILTKE